jgi:hypothetical protein
MAMNRSRKAVFNTLLASLLTTAAGVSAGTVAPGPAGEGITPVDASGSLFYAQQYLDRDKPPYVRKSHYSQQREKQQLEKGEFARFEEKPAVTGEDRQPAYRHVPGGKPPYVRIP